MRRDLRKPLFLQAAVAKAWLVHEDVCKYHEPLTVRLVHARQSERGLLDGHVTGAEGQSSQHATQQMPVERLLHAWHVSKAKDSALRWLWSPEKGGGLLEHTSGLIPIRSALQNTELQPTHPTSAFSFLPPGSLACPLGGHLSQAADSLISFLRAA